MTELVERLEQDDMISTHTPLAGRDYSSFKDFYKDYGFLLTRPLRDVTERGDDYDNAAVISTHTPLAGRDRLPLSLSAPALPISTHTPLAGRDSDFHSYKYDPRNFYSHAPCGT